MRINLYVPKDTKTTSIRHGSAIVGSPRPDGLTLIDYEGNLHGADNLRTYEGRLQCAAGRHVDRYPTIARKGAPPEDLVRIGTAAMLNGRDGEAAAWVVEHIDEPEALAEWLGQEELPETGGSSMLRERLASRAWRRLGVQDQMRFARDAQVHGRRISDLVFAAWFRPGQ